ncbi:MAG: enoyl-CoA hydratase/isomerase family protein [Deltaproteobacteria bacterium]|nr:enoyl-CoA hydratase/isomerase family protein [Deltaproteobacteria bacterium]
MPASDLLLVSTNRQVTTLTMNDPRRLNGWTDGMMRALQTALQKAADDNETKALILTGTGRYYSAGVNLGGTMKLAHPRVLRDQIIAHNQALFDLFIDFEKPLLVAVNGPAIGATVTSATLCDAVIAAESATFSTPFHRLGVPPEGCSSVHFARLMGEANARRMLGPEGWQPTAREALDAGLITEVVPDADLLVSAQRLAEGWVRAGKERNFRAGATRAELKAVNARESVDVADAFLSPRFLSGQFRFLRSKRKHGPALVFLALRLSHPLWSRLLRP